LNGNAVAVSETKRFSPIVVEKGAQQRSLPTSRRSSPRGEPVEVSVNQSLEQTSIVSTNTIILQVFVFFFLFVDIL
jgi:hypothetical protein